jgi:hypothetical protein
LCANIDGGESFSLSAWAEDDVLKIISEEYAKYMEGKDETKP